MRNETKRNAIKRNETKPIETKRSEIKRNETTLHFVSFRFDRFRFVSFDFVSFRSVSFRSVSISLRTLHIPIHDADIFRTNIILKSMIPFFYSHLILYKYFTECIDYILKTEITLPPHIALRVRAGSFVNDSMYMVVQLKQGSRLAKRIRS